MSFDVVKNCGQTVEDAQHRMEHGFSAYFYEASAYGDKFQFSSKKNHIDFIWLLTTETQSFEISFLAGFR